MAFRSRISRGSRCASSIKMTGTSFFGVTPSSCSDCTVSIWLTLGTGAAASTLSSLLGLDALSLFSATLMARSCNVDLVLSWFAVPVVLSSPAFAGSKLQYFKRALCLALWSISAPYKPRQIMTYSSSRTCATSEVLTSPPLSTRFSIASLSCCVQTSVAVPV